MSPLKPVPDELHKKFIQSECKAGRRHEHKPDDSMNNILHFGSNHNKEKSCDAIGKFQNLWAPKAENA